MYKTLIVCILSFIAVILLGGVAGWCAWVYFDWCGNRKKLRRLDEYLRAKDRGAYRRREEAD
ncbi:hypothetical protein [Synergistes jonesii]|uniref:Uncharacterized protein n=1 Tax=Synergistes jonesii TaxID=2754 RepID=A0A073IS65_9BACT|nr:hypothetical protein [Synergistes jonesii]KEJ93183.1 hypothetical protein EH55_12840 [Synergistes jonesii]OFB60703.1 hypothetical protein JS72_12060 [Synergistes jonesii]OFB64800.1 hypothetical protein JS73_02825 [Synergistes jonesii]OFB66101.1 hypothetical protein JS79_02830 [Synergistes jonesii]OFB68960.1 hypothetical protein JS78_02830 [Synergistes jonesii]